MEGRFFSRVLDGAMMTSSIETARVSATYSTHSDSSTTRRSWASNIATNALGSSGRVFCET